MIEKSLIKEGMTVYSSDGEKLGKVQACQSDRFIIEKGFFFPKDYTARVEDVADVRDDGIYLSRGREALAPTENYDQGTPTQAGIDTAGPYEPGSLHLGQMPDQAAAGTDIGRSQSAGYQARSSEEVRVPIAEEELEVVKRQREAGEVRLHKDVVTETKHLEVPVTREEVRVEHVSASGASAAAPGEGAFEEKTISVPVTEEEVEIRKRPVVKGEVRVSKERVVEQRAAEADIRKERVDVEDEEGHIARSEDPSTRRE